MKLAPKTRYAIRILFELAGTSAPQSAALLAEKTGMSLRTVETIHAILRSNGLTAGMVGAAGGIALAVPLASISLGRVVELMENGVEVAVCCGEKSNNCPNQEHCATRAVWHSISQKIQVQLNSLSLQDILGQYPEHAGLLPTGEVP